MPSSQIRVLMIEDNAGDARLIELALLEAEETAIDFVRVPKLSDGLERLASENFDLALVDLSLPDSFGMETFSTVKAQHPAVPIIVLSGSSDERMAVAAVNQGAQDYLVKGRVDGQTLARSIRYAIERQERIGQLEDLALDDELTGLRNRRGFTTIGPAWLTSDRARPPIALLFIDVNGMKQINDRLGHRQGDAALADIAGILRSTLRQSDLIARVGGDEFCALVQFGDSEREVITRIQSAVDHFNQTSSRSYKISISIGSVRYDPDNPRPLAELMTTADGEMYRVKTSAASSRRILIVEDEPDVRLLIQSLFADEFHVESAASGAEAFAAIDRAPNLILLDMNLPDYNGIDMVPKLRADPRLSKVPIIMMTATSDPSLEAECLKRGADDFIRKPFDGEILRLRVENALRRAVAR